MAAPSFNREAIRDRLLLKVVPLISDFKVIDASERDLKLTFGKIFNVAYLLRESFTKTSDGGSSNSVIRQRYEGNIEIVIVARKFVDGEVNQLVSRKLLSDSVYDALIAWKEASLFTALDLATIADGDPADTVNYGVQKWHASILHQGVVSP